MCTAGVLYGQETNDDQPPGRANCLINIWLGGPDDKSTTIPEGVLGTRKRHDRFRTTMFHAEFPHTRLRPRLLIVSRNVSMPHPMPRTARIFPLTRAEGGKITLWQAASRGHGCRRAPPSEGLDSERTLSSIRDCGVIPRFLEADRARYRWFLRAGPLVLGTYWL